MFYSDIAFGDTIFSDNFSGSHPGLWSIGHDGGGGSYAWAWPNDYAHEYADPDGSMYYYPDNLHVYMERRSVSLAGYDSASLSFSYIVDTEPTYDYLTVYVRDQSGSWHQLWRESGTTDPLSWSSKTLSLNSFVGQSGLYVQFRFDSDGSVSGSPYDGVFIDNVSLTATVQNDPPSASRESPESPISILPGTPQSFIVRGTDQDGNLDGVEWYLDGQHQESDEMSGSDDTDDWSHTFATAGTYLVEATVFDTEEEYSDPPATWTVTVESPSRGMYVDYVYGLLSSRASQLSLLEYAKQNNITYLALYVSASHPYLNPPGDDVLSDFIQFAKTSFGISEVGLIGGSTADFDKYVAYNNNHPGEIDVLNLEKEFWNSGDYAAYKSLLEYACNLGSTHNLSVETYVGWPNESQIQEIVGMVDRLFLHAYVTDPYVAYDYVRERLLWAGGSGHDVTIWPIFSAESTYDYSDQPFMGDWLKAHSLLEAENAFLDAYASESDPRRLGVEVLGFQYYAYDVMSPLLFVTASSFYPQHNTTDVAVDADLQITFADEDGYGINMTKGTTGNVTIKRVSDGAVVESIPVADNRVSIMGNIVTINPSSVLAPGTRYSILVDSTCFKSADGTTEEPPYPAGSPYLGVSVSEAWQFTTEPVPDTTPPTPDPMMWATEPYATGTDSIRMVATTASDPSGVEYYFEETSGNTGGSDSAWQDSTTHEDTGLSEATQYTYTVKARDKSPNQNATAWSTNESATTEDGTAPTPDPMTWGVVPHATGPTSIFMTATTATDLSGVEYYFAEISGNPGGTNSGWQDSVDYEDTGLDDLTEYTYTVKARDKSVNQNETAVSIAESATTEDGTAPIPEQATWASVPSATGENSISMTATTGTDPSGVEYYFDETSGNAGGSDSGWQTSPSYTDTGLTKATQYTYRVQLRDQSPNYNTGTWSTSESARTEGADVDLNGDGRIDLSDLLILAYYWMDTCSEPNWCENSDCNRSGMVDSSDLAILCSYWLETTEYPSLIGYWAMDDDADNTTVSDSSGNGNHGTARQNTEDINTAGIIDGALIFSGSSGYIDIGSPAILDNMAEFTIGLWLKKDQDGVRYSLIHKNHLQLEIGSNNKITGFRRATGSNAISISADTITGYDWHYIAMTFDDTGDRRIHIYIDGSEASYGTQITLTGDMQDDSAANLYISNPWASFNGSIDDVMIFDKVLSDAEIAQLASDF